MIVAMVVAEIMRSHLIASSASFCVFTLRVPSLSVCDVCQRKWSLQGNFIAELFVEADPEIQRFHPEPRVLQVRPRHHLERAGWYLRSRHAETGWWYLR